MCYNEPRGFRGNIGGQVREVAKNPSRHQLSFWLHFFLDQSVIDCLVTHHEKSRMCWGYCLRPHACSRMSFLCSLCKTNICEGKESKTDRISERPICKDRIRGTCILSRFPKEQKNHVLTALIFLKFFSALVYLSS